MANQKLQPPRRCRSTCLCCPITIRHKPVFGVPRQAAFTSIALFGVPRINCLEFSFFKQPGYEDQLFSGLSQTACSLMWSVARRQCSHWQLQWLGRKDSGHHVRMPSTAVQMGLVLFPAWSQPARSLQRKFLQYFLMKESLLTKQVSLCSASSSNATVWKAISPGFLIIMWSCSFALQENRIVIVSPEIIPAKTNIRRDFFSVYQSLTSAFARECILLFLSSACARQIKRTQQTGNCQSAAWYGNIIWQALGCNHLCSFLNM